ncbi:hypothetical protein [Nocardioides sp. AE5]|uniref:hypothetical protein n=1 Tax=Nocardioides sp. AE5 TaxID=2962573 RepID=UPI002880C16A|nr:hypothetical protein [Nocardioides sp. AE5]MDT0201188.1 hypothetical protein [Nocardioides sp. AE5]
MDHPAETPPAPDLVTRLVRQVLPLVALAILFAVAVRRAALTLTNDDTFFHLRFGSEFLADWSIRSPGSVTDFGTRDWVPTQWLSQMTMARTEDPGGTTAVAVLAGVAYVTYLLVLYLTCRAWSAPLVATLVAGAAFLGSSYGLSARPQVISYVLITCTVGAWLATARDGKLRWWLIPMTWAWASLHGLWPVGIVISVVAAVGISLDERDLRRLKALLVPLGSLLACALTPVGPRLLTEVLTVNSRGSYFAEWGPTDFTDGSPMILSALLALVLLAWFRTGQVSWLHGLLFLIAGAWCLYSMRTVPVGAALVAPVAAAALTRLVPEQDEATTGSDRRLAWVGWVVAVAALPLIAPHTLKVGPELPDRIEEDLAALPAGAVVLNEWKWGGYLMWKHPELDFVVSGYGDIYTTEELDRNVTLTKVDPGWDSRLDEIGPTVALLDAESRLAYALIHTSGWTVSRESDGVVLMKPPTTE